jgi:flagellar basal body-associated protein FliL
VVKKARIDLLDMAAELEDGVSPRDEDHGEVAPDMDRQDPDAGKKTGWMREWLRRLKPGKHKLLWIIGMSFILIALTGGWVWLFYVDVEKRDVLTKERADAATVLPPAEQTGLFDDFVVNVRDQKGDIRIVLCDLFVKLENPQVVLTEEERVKIREVIHAVLKRTSIDSNLLVEARNRIKIEIKEELDGLMGEKSAKNIYITRFEVI